MQASFGVSRAATLLSAGLALAVAGGPAAGEDDARMKQLKLLCAQLSGDLTDPGGIAAFHRCLNSNDPLGEIRRDNNIAAPSDRPNAMPPEGFGAHTRFHIADGIERFQVVDANLTYVLDRGGKLWRGAVDGKDARIVDQNVMAFQVGDGHVFIQSIDGILWRAKFDGSDKNRVDETVATFRAINSGLIYVLGTDHRLWREFGDASKRIEVDRAVRDFQAIDGSLVYVLGADGQLWREIGSAQARTFAAKQVVAFQYLPADNETLYVQTADAVLWRKKGNDEAERVDQAVAAFQAMNAQLVFVLGNDGRLWRETGNRDQALLVDRDVLVAAGKGAFQAADPGHVYLLGNDRKLWAETMPAVR
jgi:hypothetical protein